MGSLTESALVAGENFNLDYLKINPNGTVPSLIAPQLRRPLVDSTEILEFLDSSRQSGTKLTPEDTPTRGVMQNLIELVHSDEVGTNLILLQARSEEEMKRKRSSM